MGYIEVRQWASDSTMEMRREHPNLATRKMQGVAIEGSYDGSLHLFGWEGENRGTINLQWLRDIQPQGYGKTLRVVTEDGEELRCNRIGAASGLGRRQLELVSSDDEEVDGRTFNKLEIERIEVD